MDSGDITVSAFSIDSCQHQIRELGGTLEDTNIHLRSLLLLMAPDISNSIPIHLDSLDMFEFLLSISDKIQNSKQQIKKLSDDFQKHVDKANSTTAENVEECMEVPKVDKKSTERVCCSFAEPNIVLGGRELYNKSYCNKDELHSGWKSEVKEITCCEQQPELKDAEISPVDQDLRTNLRRSSSCIDLSKCVKLATEHTAINSNANKIKEDNEQMVGQIIKDLIASLDLVQTVVKDDDDNEQMVGQIIRDLISSIDLVQTGVKDNDDNEQIVGQIIRDLISSIALVQTGVKDDDDNEQMVGQIIKDLISSLDLVPPVVKDCNLVFQIEDVEETLRARKAKKRSRISSRIMSGFRRMRKVITRSFTVCFGRKNTF